LKELTKKRIKAYVIDSIISTTVTFGVEYFLRKKVKNEFVHNVITPSVVFWGLEYAQLRKSGQTIGYKLNELSLESEDGSKPSCEQLVKRIAYRDTVGPFKYLKDPKAYINEDGSVFAQDRFAGTVVKDINQKS
jgi:hypothetical protein